MKNRYLILDCFVDEPACFGVPPFISPYPRYIFGALVCSGTDPEQIEYHTIEELRPAGFRIEKEFTAVFLIGGAVVPGKYLGSRIGTVHEIKCILHENRHQHFILGGEAAQMIDNLPPTAVAVTGDIEKYACTPATGAPLDALRTTGELAPWAALGARVVSRHPSFPDIICEIETYRGCPRQRHCSFCSEGLFRTLEFRSIKEIMQEVDALIEQGVTRFRLGRQADILQYMTPFKNFRNGFPAPDPGAVKELFCELKKRKTQGLITVLNIDNANPGTIFNFPHESSEILDTIAHTVTPGDTLALGIESFDPEVTARNNLKVDAAGALEVIRIINETCGERLDGIPRLLPGINLIQGLRGETAETFRINYQWLINILNEGLLLKRINIRRLLPFPGTPLYKEKLPGGKKLQNRFEHFRGLIRHDIDIPMLRAIYPAGTVLKDVQVLEEHQGHVLGKQIASYSITARFPLPLPIRSFQNALVVGHRERSVLALPLPLPVNEMPQKAFEAIPGISPRRAADIILRRPFRDTGEFLEFLAEKGVALNEKIKMRLIQ